jgi:dienelactone hydrolase
MVISERLNSVGNFIALKERRRRLAAGLRRLVEKVAPGQRAWRGATWGVLVMLVVVWGITAYAGFALAGPVALLAGMLGVLLLSAVVAAHLLGLGWLLGRLPVRYHWALLTALLPLLFAFLTPSLVIGTALAVLGLLLFTSLVGAGLAAVTGGNWRRLTRLHKVLAAGGLALGSLGLLAGGGLLLTDGFATTPPTNAAAESATAVSPLTLPNPADLGPYPVLTLTYGSGADRHRPEYGAEAALIAESVDGKALINGWSQLRTAYWGFGPDALPRNGRVWYPDGDGPFPLVLIVHGNHMMEDYSDAGYAYLGRMLASRGYVVASVDQNFLNGSLAANLILISPLKEENALRGWLLLEHLRQWQAWQATPGNPFSGKVDFNNIALIGHSRGGEAAAIAAAFSRLGYYPDDASVTFDYDFGIRSVVAIAPADGQSLPGGRPLPLTDVNYLTLHGAHDMDVVTFMGMRQYNRVQFSGDEPFFKAALYIYGANHGQFNSDWGRRDLFSPAMQLYNLRTIMPAAEQEQIAQVAISAFLDATLRGETGYQALFRDPRSAAAWLPDTIYLSQYQDSDTLRLATYEEDIDLRTTTRPGGRLQGENLTVWREQVVPLRRGSLANSAVYLGWDQNEGGQTARYTLTLPDDVLLDESAVLTFSLAAVAENPNPNENAGAGLDSRQPLDLTLVLVDGQGRQAALPLSHFALLQPPLPARLGKAGFMNVMPLTEIVFQTFDFPLAAFTAANPALDVGTASQVHFVFDRSPAGVVALDEIGLRGSSLR